MFRIEGKVSLSKLGTESIKFEDQGDTQFCWLFALAQSIVASLRVRLGTAFYMTKPVLSNFLARVTNIIVKHDTSLFLKKRDINQVIRRELCFGLIPKTLKRKTPS